MPVDVRRRGGKKSGPKGVVAMPKARRIVTEQEGVGVLVFASYAVAGYLDDLVETGLYGASREIAAQRLIETRIAELIEFGILERKT